MTDSSSPPEEASSLRHTMLAVSEELLEAQLSAVRKLQGKPSALLQRSRSPQTRKKGMSHIDMAFDILAKAGRSLHVSALIDRIQQAFGIRLDSESLVSALSKRVARADRFTRTAPNTFGLLDLSQEPLAKAASKPAASARRSPSKNQSPKKSHEPK